MSVSKSDLLMASVKRLKRRDAHAHIKKILLKSHPAEVASVVRQMSDDDGVALIHLIRDSKIEAETFSELGGGFLETYLNLNPDDIDHIVLVMQKLPKDDAVAILGDLHEDLSQKILGLMKETRQIELAAILDYEEDTCGRIMDTDVFKLNDNLTAKEAIEKIQTSGLKSIFYIYCVDDNNHILGVVSLRQVLQVQQSTTLNTIMKRNVIFVNPLETQEQAADKIEEYNFVSLPVVSDSGKLLGIITVDDIIDYIRDEAQDEVLQLAGVESEGVDDFSFTRSFLARGAWYGLLFFGGVLCSELIYLLFVGFPPQIVYLCFAPMILRIGGSVAMQTSTFVNQSILDEGIEKERGKRALIGQNLVILTLVSFLSVGLYSYTFYRFGKDVIFSLGIGIGFFTVAVVALILGMIIPLIFHKIKWDALQASSRFIHFLMDVLSLLVFFEAVWIWHDIIN